MSKTRNLLESIQSNLKENELLNAVQSILDKDAIQKGKSILATYDNVDLWITDTYDKVKLDTKKDKGAVLHTQKGDMNGPSLHLSASKSNGYISAIKNLKNQFDKHVNVEIEEKFIIAIDDKYLGNDGTLVNRNEAKIYNDSNNAEHDLIFYLQNNDGEGEVISLSESTLKEDEELDDEELKMVNRVEEVTGYDIEECKQIVKDGNYVFFPNVSNKEDLGRAYVDMVGGVLGINNVESYIDDTEIKEGIAEYLDDIGETYTDNDLNSMAAEDIEMAIAGKDEDYLIRYFDFEKLGEDLYLEDWYFASDGAIEISY